MNFTSKFIAISLSITLLISLNKPMESVYALSPKTILRADQIDLDVYAPSWQKVENEEIKIIGHLGGFLIKATSVQYNGKEYVMKRVVHIDQVKAQMKLNRFLLPQSKYYNYLRKERPDIKIGHTRHFLEWQGTKCILFEKLPGKTLLEYTDQLPLLRALKITLNASKVIKSLLDQGIYHWDIKPNNILLDEENDDDINFVDLDLTFSSREEFIRRELWKIGHPKWSSITRDMNRDLTLAEVTRKSDNELFSHSDEISSLMHCLIFILRSEDKHWAEGKLFCFEDYDIDQFISFLESQIAILQQTEDNDTAAESAV